jgi:hypothetical protein
MFICGIRRRGRSRLCRRFVKSALLAREIWAAGERPMCFASRDNVAARVCIKDLQKLIVKLTVPWSALYLTLCIVSYNLLFPGLLL